MQWLVPVSALIHAATMVIAGVYLIARTHYLVLDDAKILYLVAIVGVITLILTEFTALVQTDNKLILVYSTIEPNRLYVLALGVQAWNTAIFI